MMHLMLMTPEEQKHLAFAVQLVWVGSGVLLFLIKKVNKVLEMLRKQTDMQDL